MICSRIEPINDIEHTLLRILNNIYFFTFTNCPEFSILNNDSYKSFRINQCNRNLSDLYVRAERLFCLFVSYFFLVGITQEVAIGAF